MTQQELLKDLLIKLKKYKNCETLLRYLDNLEECFNEMNKKYSIEAFPTKYITEQKKIITDVIQENNRDITCKECVKFLKEKEKLTSSIERRRKLLSNEKYVNNAPSNIVDAERQKLEEEEKLLEEMIK